MWNNYVIIMIRKYKSWTGLAMLNLLGMIGVYGLITLLISSYLISFEPMSLLVIILIVLIIGIAYVNYITLQLRKRLKEFYVRKLLGASDNQVMLQLLMESIVLSAFLVVSGMVLAEFMAPFCGVILGTPISVSGMHLVSQFIVVILLVLPIGVLGVIFPIRSFINYLRVNFSRLSHRGY